MSRHGDITLDWADGQYTFRLAWGELIKLQEACDAGPQHILDRLTTGKWKLEDIEHVIFQGLVGGGMTTESARKLMRIHVRECPPAENLVTASWILGAAIYGAADDKAEIPPGKATAGESPSFPAES